jgi:hypothetical protein
VAREVAPLEPSVAGALAAVQAAVAGAARAAATEATAAVDAEAAAAEVVRLIWRALATASAATMADSWAHQLPRVARAPGTQQA